MVSESPAILKQTTNVYACAQVSGADAFRQMVAVDCGFMAAVLATLPTMFAPDTPPDRAASSLPAWFVECTRAVGEAAAPGARQLLAAAQVPDVGAWLAPSMRSALCMWRHAQLVDEANVSGQFNPLHLPCAGMLGTLL